MTDPDDIDVSVIVRCCLGLGIQSGIRNRNRTRNEKPDPLSDPKYKNTRTDFVGWYKKYPNPKCY